MGLAAAVLLAASSGARAAEPYKVVNSRQNFYYGHISYIDTTPNGTDPVVVRLGSAEEKAVLNLPIGPGDTIRTSADRRCEVQFDTGTVVRLDFSTELKVETILARSLSSLQELSNLALDKGRIYVMYRAYDGRELFQLLTGNASVKMKHNAVALITAAADGATETQMTYGKARVLFGASAKLLEDREVKKGERLIVQNDSQFQLAAAIEGTDFELWNKEVNAHFEDLHEGMSALPKPVQNLPPAVFYFAQTYGSLYGEWLWDEFYGYVWRPFLNNGMYPWGWRPYFYGQWSYSGGQMFWVPMEPWGWIPYHLGVWQWDKKHGWVWLPGSLFAPAWATWDFFFGYAGWRPLGLYDWMGGRYSYYGGGFNYTDGAWNYLGPSAGGTPGGPQRNVSNIVRKDQLKQPAAPSLPLPTELRGALKKVTAAYERGDARIRDSAAAVPTHLVFVPKGELRSGAVQGKAMSWQDVSRTATPPAKDAGPLRRPADPQREAARIFRGGDRPAAVVPQKQEAPAAKTISTGTFVAVPLVEGAAAVPRRSEARRVIGDAGGNGAGAPVENGPAGRDAGPAARFRDWNPDVRIARQLGVHIEYSSQRNEVHCPELNLSSRLRERGSGIVPNLTPQGVSYGPASSFNSSGSGSSGSWAAPASSASASKESSGSAGGPSGGSGKEGSGGKIKN